MDTLSKWLFLATGISAGVAFLLVELRWKKRNREWERLEAVVVDLDRSGDSTDCPVVNYTVSGVVYERTLGAFLDFPIVGQTWNIICDPNNPSRCATFSRSARVTPSLVLLIVSIVTFMLSQTF
jgi:hypothetical protein